MRFKNAAGPLRGLRVLDLSRLVAGNMLSVQLADFGAEVIKIEDVEERNNCDCRTNILRLDRRAAAGLNPPSDRIASTHRGGNASCPAM